MIRGQHLFSHAPVNLSAHARQGKQARRGNAQDGSIGTLFDGVIMDPAALKVIKKGDALVHVARITIPTRMVDAMEQ